MNTNIFVDPCIIDNKECLQDLQNKEYRKKEGKSRQIPGKTSYTMKCKIKIIGVRDTVGALGTHFKVL